MKLGVIKMKVKGKNIYNSEQALEFSKTVRGQYIISQALTIARNVLMGYENDFEIWDNEFDEIPSDKRNDKHVTKWNTLSARCEPSNRSDMDFLLSAFPLYKIHEHDVWGFDASIDEDENEEIEN